MSIEQALLHRPVLIVAAHPDDETLGAGGILPRLRDVAIAHITDGAPRDLPDARNAGFDSREEYAAARWRELTTAMRLAGVADSQLHPLGVVDQEASLAMPELAAKLAELIRTLRPGVLVTHPYEGGHPDHDTAAFAVHAACAAVPAPPKVYEFTSYHAASPTNPAMVTGRFLPGTELGEAVVLSEADRERKQTMIQCFPTQVDVLRRFALDLERFRPAPAYDFTEAPHAGKLLYEHFGWDMTGARWRRLAVEALRALGATSIL